MTISSDPILSVRDLTVVLRRNEESIPIVQSTSFDVRKGEIFGLVGESGSGKSLSLRAIMRLLPQQMQITGEILWRDRDVLKLDEKELRKVRGGEISMIFQEPMTALNPVLTIGRQISESLKAHGKRDRRERKRRAVELLDLVGIPSAARRLEDYPHQFSGGMRQRAMIAIALASDPSLILADEPTTALDVTIQDQILALLLKLRDELGVSVALVTHDLGVVSAICDRVSIMYAGQILERGPAESLLTRPQHPYTLGLIESIPNATAAGQPLTPITGSPPAPNARPPGCLFSPRCRFSIPTCEQTRPELVALSEARASACLRQSELVREHVFQ
ncbi:ABC transporter ATP-binding protein [Rhizobium leguminosarum]|nr:ABC transporter ATP-binding protein [Rhizobium leguminosarum]MBY2970902.1 ABC transporter ATP-binding protein [Rhizobium leguminosarum]MBY2977969.1 ABC transporter ATP-binding protein [Rhizobium leguminosarum]MBY3006519.1 ABC transporter ATP-binding protein [Rhizobium leguminosarum]